ncbi:uncharacterized protein LOC129791204 [Lutzomyia longipalpis]|uniref:uncharacterized protein LOC129791204 n=1 Tax=Lutzomyia longipalpis TaxID=7200 RepID=UPI002483FD62|nr:uncharacterized protein LOC129791204 [Lutzomyia longipalpis]
MQNFLLVSLALAALMLCAEAKPYDFPLYQDLIQGVIQRESQAEREKRSPNEDYEKQFGDIVDQIKEISFNVMKMPHFGSSDDNRDDSEYVDHHYGDEDDRDYDHY